jgi:hypothetical protein
MAMNTRSCFLATPKKYRPDFFGWHFSPELFERRNAHHFLRGEIED